MLAMKGSFTAPGGALTAAVQYAAKWLDTKPANPVHGGLVLDVTDRTLTIASQGELATARASLDVDGDAAGRFIVSGRLLAAIVATLADKPVTFEQTGSSVAMTSGRYSSTLPAMPEKDYPDLTEVAPTIGRIEGAALIDAVRRVGSVASKEVKTGTDQVILSGIYFWMESDEGELTMIATNRLQACRETVEWKLVGDEAVAESLVLPASVLIDAGEAFAGGDLVEIGRRGGVVSLSVPSRSLVTRTLGEPSAFPDLGGLFAQIDQRTHAVALSARDVLVPLKRADQLADSEHRHVTLELSKDLLVLRSATDGKGDGGEEIDVEYDGPDCAIVTRSAMLHGLLATAPGDAIVLHIGPGNPRLSVIATSPANPAWTHLFMPIRSTGGKK
jgi:DNA polymerase-3 subunit beta